MKAMFQNRIVTMAQLRLTKGGTIIFVPLQKFQDTSMSALNYARECGVGIRIWELI